MTQILFLSSNLKRLLLGELSALVNEIKRMRAKPISETDGAERSEYMQRRINQARKSTPSRRIQRREKLVRDRRREIDRENKKAAG